MGAKEGGVADALIACEPRPATRAEMERVHPATYLDALERFCASGGGKLDEDTKANDASWDAASLAAGAGLAAVEALDEGSVDSAFCAVRPPGHHALATRAMGFCLLNNVAITAAALADRGERVLIVDYDAHHGNGTQDIFYSDDRVLYVSMHEWPLYPGTGAITEIGRDAGRGHTLNFPFPEGATGDIYLEAIDEVLTGVVTAFGPTWLLISAGFDAHRRDPLTGLALSSGDYSMITRRLLEFVPRGRRLVYLEGGYDLQALADSTGSALAALVGIDHRPEPATTGGPGRHVVHAVRDLWIREGLLAV